MIHFLDILKKQALSIFIILLGLQLYSSCASSAVTRGSDALTSEHSAVSAEPEREVPDEALLKKGAVDSGYKSLESGIECDPDSLKRLYSEVNRQKITSGEKDFFPVRDGNSLIYISENPDYYVLYSDGVSPDDVTLHNVSDLKNVYKEETGLRRYLLAVYRCSADSVSKTRHILLEGKGTFNILEKKLIDKNTKKYAVIAGFTTSEGIQEELVISDSSGNYSITRIRNTISDFTLKEDYDNDGILDLVRYEQVFVDGSGAETFITWYKFDGSKYKPVKTLNTVRDLRIFLDKAESFLEARDTGRFIRDSVNAETINKLKAAGVSEKGILQRIFYPARRESADFTDINTLLSSERGIDFIFPRILENPFRFERDNLYSFTAYVRAALKGADPGTGTVSDDTVNPGDQAVSDVQEEKNEAIYLVRIYMSANPFAGRRFFFFVN